MDSKGHSRFKKNSECEVRTSTKETRKAVVINCIDDRFSLVKYFDDGYTEEVSNKRLIAIKSYREKLKEAINVRIEYERIIQNRSYDRLPILPSRGWLISPRLIAKLESLQNSSSPSSNCQTSKS